MNKYQEALYTLTDWFHSYTNKKGITIQERHITPAYVKAKKTIQELVDKEIPRKVLKTPYKGIYGNKIEKTRYFFNGCPNCENIVSRYSNYCSNCGQRLDWGDEDE